MVFGSSVVQRTNHVQCRLSEEKLPGVHHRPYHEGVIISHTTVDMCHDVHMLRPAGVETWEGRECLHDAIAVRGLQAAEISEADSIFVRFVGVDAGAVGIPEIDINSGHWLASVDVCDLDVEEKVDAGLILADVLADKHTVDVFTVGIS